MKQTTQIKLEHRKNALETYMNCLVKDIEATEQKLNVLKDCLDFVSEEYKRTCDFLKEQVD